MKTEKRKKLVFLSAIFYNQTCTTSFTYFQNNAATNEDKFSHADIQFSKTYDGSNSKSNSSFASIKNVVSHRERRTLMNHV